MEDVSQKKTLVLAILSALLPISAGAATEPKFEKTLYTADFAYRGSSYKIELGSVKRAEELGRSRIMATIRSEKGVEAVCERVLKKQLTPSDIDSIPMTCAGALFAPATQVAASFLFADTLRKPLLKISPDAKTIDEVALDYAEPLPSVLTMKKKPAKLAEMQ